MLRATGVTNHSFIREARNSSMLNTMGYTEVPATSVRQLSYRPTEGDSNGLPINAVERMLIVSLSPDAQMEEKMIRASQNMDTSRSGAAKMRLSNTSISARNFRGLPSPRAIDTSQSRLILGN